MIASGSFSGEHIIQIWYRVLKEELMHLDGEGRDIHFVQTLVKTCLQQASGYSDSLYPWGAFDEFPNMVNAIFSDANFIREMGKNLGLEDSYKIQPDWIKEIVNSDEIVAYSFKTIQAVI